VAGRVPEHVIQQIVAGVDIVRLVERHCELTRKGKKYWGLCPFHQEKTPSFSVDPDNGLYYCFGCKEGGNVFTLLEKLEGLGFAEALERLAREVGVDLGPYRSGPAEPPGQAARLRRVNELAAGYYEKCLEKARGADLARRYLKERGFTDETIERWRLGYAPDGWENFLKCATARGFSPEEVQEAGLAVPRQGAPGHYDRFRNRLIFPIADGAERVIAFGARALQPEDEPKYLNTPETPLFHKGRNFFGLARARDAMRSADTAVILEGYTDVLMAHQAGVTHTLAVLGTALTQDHARTLRRLCAQVVLVFDADEAGQKSAARSIETLLNEELEVRVADLPAGQDPCDFVRAEGAEAFRRRLDESRGFFEYRLAHARAREADDSPEARMRVFGEVAELALQVNDPARRDLIVRRLAHELGVREGNAWAWLDRHRRRRPHRSGEARPDAPRRPPTARETFVRELLGLLLAHPELAPRAAGMDRTTLGDGPEARLLTALLEQAGNGRAPDLERFLGGLSDADLAGTASAALAEEQARLERIAETTAEARLDGYLGYARSRQRGATGRRPLQTDEELREYVRRLKEDDRRSAQPR